MVILYHMAVTGVLVWLIFTLISCYQDNSKMFYFTYIHLYFYISDHDQGGISHQLQKWKRVYSFHAVLLTHGREVQPKTFGNTSLLKIKQPTEQVQKCRKCCSTPHKQVILFCCHDPPNFVNTHQKLEKLCLHSLFSYCLLM